MVEMLGVLAVMGVLSVGGVAMYTNAMNKYRANEILNEASKRAVMVAGQLLTNPNATTMSLAQFGSNAVAGATFGENAAISNGKITLTFETAPDEAICNQMIAATGTNSAMQVAPGCGTITFNADMSLGTSTNSGTGDPDPVVEDDIPTCDPACTGGRECVTENTCTCPDDTPIWTGKTCEASKKSECTSDQYYNIYTNRCVSESDCLDMEMDETNHICYCPENKIYHLAWNDCWDSCPTEDFVRNGHLEHAYTLNGQICLCPEGTEVSLDHGCIDCSHGTKKKVLYYNHSTIDYCICDVGYNYDEHRGECLPET